MNLLKTFLIAVLIQGSIIHAQIGIQTNTPDASSALDIVATDKGILIPRVVLTNNLSSPLPVTSPATGLLVFNTGANQAIGFYYWSGSAWISIGGGSVSGDYWTLIGNASTIDGTNFLGTTDNIPLNFRVNNQKAGRIESSGTTFLGYQAGNINTATSSTGVGYQALLNNTSGTFNSAFGYNAGPNAANLTNTTALGYNAIATSSNQVRLGDNNVTSLFCMGAYNSAVPEFPNLYIDANGQIMRSANALGYPGWLLTGNAGTTVGTNFIGTTDNVGFAINTNNIERIRIEDDGQVLVGATAPLDPLDILSVFGTPGGGTSAINAYNSSYGVYSVSEAVAMYGEVNNATGIAGYFRNNNIGGNGVINAGANIPGNFWASPNNAGTVSLGNNGINAIGYYATGNGILASGSGYSSLTTIATGTGGTFTGYHGVYGKGNNTTVGTGIIGTGNNLGSYSTLLNGSGGSFYGNDGVFGKAFNTSGIGVIGLGNNGTTYYYIPAGSGGAFTGFHGVYGQAINSGGTGVIGCGNNSPTAYYATGGSGGSFTGNQGSISTATNSSGTGVIGVGNNVLSAYTVANGSGGAFTGDVCGVYGYATNSSNDRYGGYFATAGSLYAYVGGRYAGTNRKIVGTGSVSTIVKNTEGERITLTCPEAPEIVFQDFGIGELQNGTAHITIDPDLAININVSETHPLKVFITLEGDCKGVYVTNKSAEGFDVIELQGGQSNVSFSWQIVATRANEINELRDGTTEINDNSQRFQPAPPPLEELNEKTQSLFINQSENISAKPIEMQSQEIKPLEKALELKK